jgi:hypothetical protein
MKINRMNPVESDAVNKFKICSLDDIIETWLTLA